MLHGSTCDRNIQRNGAFRSQSPTAHGDILSTRSSPRELVRGFPLSSVCSVYDIAITERVKCSPYLFCRSVVEFDKDVASQFRIVGGSLRVVISGTRSRVPGLADGKILFLEN